MWACGLVVVEEEKESFVCGEETALEEEIRFVKELWGLC